ncbi:MAG: tail fiber domain-containing protein [Phycisphaerae bacterium]|nr:tail fiber domain-containing protein [Saprospiraceae bacterium]
MKNLFFKLITLAIVLLAMAQNASAQWDLSNPTNVFLLPAHATKKVTVGNVAGTNNGTLDLNFGATNSGEGIGSKRTAGGNQWGLDFYTAGANRMSITNAGKVGISNTAPPALLSVGSTAVNSSFNFYQFGYGAAKTNTSLIRAGTLAQSNESVQPFSFYVAAMGAAADANRVGVLQTGVEGLNNSGNIALQAYGGKVGVGTLAPAATLHVNGNSGSVGGRNFTVRYSPGGGLLNTEFSALAHLGTTVGGNGWAALYAKSGSAEAAGYFDGKVVVGTGPMKLGLGDASGQALAWGTSYLGFNAVRSKTGGTWTFYGNSADNGGNVIWGDVGGSIRFATVGRTGGSDQTLTDATLLSQTKMFIRTDGNVGIGTTNPGNYKLYVNGDAYTTGTKWFTSDKRFKQNIAPVQNALEKVLELKGKTYRYNRKKFPEFNFSEGTHYGFLAQELREVVPEAVREDAAGYLAVNYDMLIPLLAEGMKELKSEKDVEITALKTRLAEKDRQISALEMRMAKLEALLIDNRSGEVAPVKAQPSVTLTSRPNPFSEVTTVDFNLPETVKTATLLVTDLQGKVLHQQILETRGQGNIQVNLSSFVSGTYICTMFTDGIPTANTKLILQAKY